MEKEERGLRAVYLKQEIILNGYIAPFFIPPPHHHHLHKFSISLVRFLYLCSVAAGVTFLKVILNGTKNVLISNFLSVRKIKRKRERERL